MIDVVVVMMINLLLMIKKFNFRRECFFTFGTGNEWTCHLIDSFELGVSDTTTCINYMKHSAPP